MVDLAFFSKLNYNVFKIHRLETIHLESYAYKSGNEIVIKI